MQLTAEIQKLPSGRYSVCCDGPCGPVVGDGMSIEGVIRVVSLAIVDALAECVDLADLDRWEND